MSVNKAIKTAVEPIVSVCVPHVYKGIETEYCTFNFTTYPAEYGDNAPQSIGYSIQLHYFLPLNNNPNEKLSQLSDALFDAGFDYPQIVDVTDEDGQHYVFETGCIEGRT